MPSDPELNCRKRVEDAIKVLGVASIDILILRSPLKAPEAGIEEIAKGMKVNGPSSFVTLKEPWEEWASCLACKAQDSYEHYQNDSSRKSCSVKYTWHINTKIDASRVSQ